jgi:hypothetical protein
LGQTYPAATIGTVVGTLAEGEAALFDDRAAIEVELLHPGMILSGAEDGALVNGANLAAIGSEIIQYGAVEQIGPRHYRLSRLLRGRRGTEAAAVGHVAGETFTLLDGQTLLPLDVGLAGLGATVTVAAQGPGDGGTVTSVSLPVDGRALRPLAPVRLRTIRMATGALRSTWVRRSRDGWAWTDGHDVPIGEDVERYRVTTTAIAGGDRVAEVAVPLFDYDPAMQAADGVLPGDAVTISVVQIGKHAASAPVTATHII